jgi:hypothetical protein
VVGGARRIPLQNMMIALVCSKEEKEDVLLLLQFPFFKPIKEIDELLLKQEVGEKELEQAKNLIARNSESYRYFFDKAGDNWLEPLIKNNFFTKPRSTFRRDNFISTRSGQSRGT